MLAIAVIFNCLIYKIIKLFYYYIISMQRKNLLQEQIKATSIQKNYLENLLKDFSRVRQKCEMYCFKMGRQLPNVDVYQELQAFVNQKIHLSNHATIASMRKKLTISIKELTELQRNLSCQREKERALKQQGKSIKKMNIPLYSSSSIATSNISIPISQTSIGQLGLASKNGQFHKKKIKEQSLPFYTVRKQCNEDKLDSINKFISKLRKNMKSQTQQPAPQKFMQYLLLSNEYQKLKQQCERIKMRTQELPQIILKQIEKGIIKFIENQEQVEANQNYVTIKIPRNSLGKQLVHHNHQKTISKNETFSHPNQQKKFIRARKSSNSSNNEFENMAFIKNTKKEPRPLLRRTNHFHKQVKQQKLYEPMYNCRMVAPLSQISSNFIALHVKDEDSETKIQSMIDSLAQSVNESELKISQIRTKRKQLEEDDIWKLIDEV